nr:hypothetical protein [bacterium]
MTIGCGLIASIPSRIAVPINWGISFNITSDVVGRDFEPQFSVGRQLFTVVMATDDYLTAIFTRNLQGLNVVTVNPEISTD